MNSIVALLAVGPTLGLTQTPAHRVVIEVNVPGTVAYGTILNNAENVIKAFAPEKVEVEIVCHGEGIKLLQPAATHYSARIMKLHTSGVTFAACANTIKGKHLKPSDLYGFVTVVKSGINSWRLAV